MVAAASTIVFPYRPDGLVLVPGASPNTFVTFQGVGGPAGPPGPAGGVASVDGSTGAVVLSNIYAPNITFAMGLPSGDTTGATDAAKYATLMAAATTAGKGEIVFARGDYWMATATRTTNNATNLAAYDGHCMLVTTGNITIRGAGKGATRIHRLAPGGAAGTSYALKGGAVWRGGGFFIQGTVNAGNITFKDFTLDGGAAPTGNGTIPANTSTGDGWDVTDKGIWYENGGTFGGLGEFSHDNIEITNFRGELLFASCSATGVYGTFTVKNCLIHGTNGDCQSLYQGQIKCINNEMFNAVGCAIDDVVFTSDAVYEGNFVHDANIGYKISYGWMTAPFGYVQVMNNKAKACPTAGYMLYNPQNVEVIGNAAVDCGTTAANCSYLFQALAGQNSPITIGGLKVRRNRAYADTVSVIHGFNMQDAGAGTSSNTEMTDNSAELTAYGAAHSVTLTQGYNVVVTDAKFLFADNRSRGATYKYSDNSVVLDQLLGTGGGNIVLRRPQRNPSNYMVLVSFRVVTAATAVILQTTWFDTAGTSHTVVFESGGSKAVGSYNQYAPVFFAASDNGDNTHPVSVYAQAGTANQVYASAQIIELPTM